jgi:protein required for attachment to host cells
MSSASMDFIFVVNLTSVLFFDFFKIRDTFMKNKWILIANTNQATVYSSPEAQQKLQLTLVKAFNHPDSRGHAKDLTAARPGHYTTSTGAHGAFEEPNHKAIEIERFAKELADYIETGSNQHLYTKLDIYAEPHFLGIFMKALPEQLHAYIDKKIHHDYVALPMHELSKILNKHME